MESFNRKTFLKTGVTGTSAMLALNRIEGGYIARELIKPTNWSAEAGVLCGTNGIFGFQNLIPNCQYL